MFGWFGLVSVFVDVVIDVDVNVDADADVDANADAVFGPCCLIVVVVVGFVGFNSGFVL